MIHKIEVVPKTKTAEILFFREIDLDELTDPRIVPLFGTNGVGKSTLLEAIANCLISREEFFRSIRVKENVLGGIHPCNSALNVDDLRLYGVDLVKLNRINQGRSLTLYVDDVHLISVEYFNSIDNAKTGFSRICGEEERKDQIKANIEGISEGQSIVYSLFDTFDSLLNNDWVFTTPDGKRIVYVLLLDEIDSGLSVDNIDTLMQKIKRILEKFENHIQIFMSFNNPVVLDYFPEVISMYSGKVTTMHTLDDMRREMYENRDAFGRARNERNGKPKEHDGFVPYDPNRSSQGTERSTTEGVGGLVRIHKDNN